MQQEIEKVREFWKNIARKNNWYTEPFPVIVWVDEIGQIVNSVSHTGLKKDYILDSDTEEELTLEEAIKRKC